MIIRLGLWGAVAALAITLSLARGAAFAQAVGSGVITSGDPVAGGTAAGAFNPEFGPNAQDAPKESTLSVRVYNAKMEYARGFVDLQVGKFHEAAGEFGNALEVHPDDYGSLFPLGMARSGEGDLKGALVAFEKALKVNSQQIAVRREFAVTLAKLGQTDKARAQLGMLKLRADVCGASCPQAEEFTTAVTQVETALASAPTPPTPDPG